MIDISFKELALLALSSFVCGILLGILYEPVSLLSMTVKGKSRVRKIFHGIMLFIFDLIFAVSAGLCGIMLFWSYGSVFRMMTFAFMGIGYLLYRVTLGRLALRLNKLLCDLLKRCILKLYRLTLIPLNMIKNALIHLYHLTIGAFLGKIIGRIKEARETRRKKRGDSCAENTEKGEEVIYVGENAGYRKEGRYRFG